jgi:Fe-Mn family superoxide dismutase
MKLHRLPDLKYSLSALEPFLSRETLEFHYGRHHQGYVNKLNELVQGTPEQDMSLSELVVVAAEGPLFNNAGQHWNHSFFWNCMSPDAALVPRGPFLQAIERDFGSWEAFQDEFEKQGASHFGSGWVWLVREDRGGRLSVRTTHDAGNPLRMGDAHPLLVCDLWEHAYYIDYRNERARFLKAFWNFVNWSFVQACYDSESVHPAVA